MTDLSNGSFIPRQGPVKKRRRSASKKVYFFSLVCYVAFLATLLGSAGVYFYGELVDRQLDEEVVALNSEISSFNEINMQRVQEFDTRLQQAYDRLNKSASIVSIFSSLEAATINTVSLNSLSIERENDEVFNLAANINTDSFDSTIFQREIYEGSDTIDSVSIEGLQSSGLNASVSTEDSGLESEISFIAEIKIPLDAVPYVSTSVIRVAPEFEVEETSPLPIEADLFEESTEVNQDEI